MLQETNYYKVSKIYLAGGQKEFGGFCQEKPLCCILKRFEVSNVLKHGGAVNFSRVVGVDQAFRRSFF